MTEVVGILLAAGTGTRFDAGNKLLADLDGEPVVAHAAWTLLESPVDPVVAVLGYEGALVARTLGPYPVRTVNNPRYEEGQATSLERGVVAAEDYEADAAVFMLGDLPRVAPETVAAIVERWRETDAGIVVPTYDGRRGNPALFDARHFDALAAVTGDRGGRALFEEHPVERVAVDDPGIHQDVDTDADLDELRED